MYWDYLALAFSGLTGIGIAMTLRRLRGEEGKVWLMPVLAACSMLAYSLASEYSWYGRAVNAMPESFTVTMTRENATWYRPWTQALPSIDGFVALDRKSIALRAEDRNTRLVHLYVFTRNQKVARAPIAYDCAAQTMADVIPDQKMPPKTAWMPVDPNDINLVLACTQPV